MPRFVDRSNRKTCCEDCLVLDAGHFLRNRQLQQHPRGTLSWPRTGSLSGWRDGATAHIEYQETRASRHIHLRYGVAPKSFCIFNPDIADTPSKHVPPDNVVSYTIQLNSTPQRLGECRYWFLCPLMKEGKICERRVRCLYLPQTAEYFGCRHCYDLVYRSSQEHNTRMGAIRKKHRDSLDAITRDFIHRYCITHGFGIDTEERLFKSHKVR